MRIRVRFILSQDMTNSTNHHVEGEVLHWCSTVAEFWQGNTKLKMQVPAVILKIGNKIAPWALKADGFHSEIDILDA